MVLNLVFRLFRQTRNREKNNIELLIVSFGVVILDAGILYLYKMLSKKATMEKEQN